MTGSILTDPGSRQGFASASSSWTERLMGPVRVRPFMYFLTPYTMSKHDDRQHLPDHDPSRGRRYICTISDTCGNQILMHRDGGSPDGDYVDFNQDTVVGFYDASSEKEAIKKCRNDFLSWDFKADDVPWIEAFELRID